MDRNEFLKIIKKYRNGTASKGERRFVEAYYDLLDLQDGMDKTRLDEALQDELLKRVWERIHEKEKVSSPGMKLLARYKKAVAVIILLLATGITFYLIDKKQTTVHEQPVAANTVVIKPAEQKAVLTLADGKNIPLGAGSRQALEGIAKQDSGQLVYQEGEEDLVRQAQYNTLTTPRGGKFKIILSDGTIVWMNAGSSLYYPVAFRGKTRRVKLTGEAYFEVAHNKARPFIVEVGKSEVRVLGTKFNIKAYQEAPDIKTTLAEGKVRAVIEGKSRLLQPGEQAIISRNTAEIVVKKVNVQAMLSWKNNLFYFEDTNIKQIMNELSRWYDVDVVYKTDQLKGKNFSGITSRYKDVDELLKRMELTGTIHFKVEGKTITVTD